MFDPWNISKSHSGGEETRSALISAATIVFLEEGYRAARVKDIADRAGLRLSAINYHFGGKEGLYLAVLQYHADLAVVQVPLTVADPRLTVKERLDRAITGLVERMLNPDSESRIGPLMLREMVNQTPALDVLYQRFALPQASLVIQIISEALGPQVPMHVVQRASFSILGQCAAYFLVRPMIDRMCPEIYEGSDFMARIVQHVSQFSWAGLIAIRADWEGRSAS